MAFSFTFLILFLALTAHAGTINDSCETHIDSPKTCSAVISFSGTCYSSKVVLSNTQYAKCTSNNFFYSYPRNNMTLVIETQFTQKHQPYTIYLDNERLMGAFSHVYRVFNNEETEITTQDAKLIQYSDSNYQVILKFQGPARLSLYGVNINYDSVPMF
jgi:hypothetical protein